MPEPLTTVERQVYDYIIDQLGSNSYQPSVREITRRFGLTSTRYAAELLASIARKGWVERDASRSRGLRLLGVEVKVTRIPGFDTP